MPNLDAPSDLPVNLSHTSIESYLKCPEAWRRRYIEKETTRPVGIQILGRAVHAAEAQSYATMIETGEPHSLTQVLDDYSTSLENEREADDVDYEDDDPGEIKDRGAAMLRAYHRDIVPHMRPEKAENRFELKLKPEYNWHISGLIDIVGAYDDGFIVHPTGPHDIKTVKKSKSEDQYNSSIQASLYTYATSYGQSDEPVPFRVHQLKVLKDGAHADMLETTRTREAQMLYLERVAMVAREIDYRTQTGNWQGAAPGAWNCSPRYCAYWNSCPMGGLAQ